jgi:hypothetical protein
MLALVTIPIARGSLRRHGSCDIAFGTRWTCSNILSLRTQAPARANEPHILRLINCAKLL